MYKLDIQQTKVWKLAPWRDETRRFSVLSWLPDFNCSFYISRFVSFL